MVFCDVQWGHLMTHVCLWARSMIGWFTRDNWGVPLASTSCARLVKYEVYELT